MDIVEQLRKYECMCTNEQCRSCAAADEIERLRHKHVKWKTLEEFRNLPEALREIERLRGLVTELLPAALNDAEQGVSIGPPPEGNDFCQQCDQTCDDCDWHNQSVAFMDRYNKGYYNI